MSIAELTRAIDSKKRVYIAQSKDRASYDYVLADLIGRSVARIYSSSAQMPSISEVYPTLFDSVEQQIKVQEKKDELSTLRFKQFAQAYNKKFRKEVGEKND